MPFWSEQRWHWNQDESTSHFKCNDETKKFDPEATLNPNFGYFTCFAMLGCRTYISLLADLGLAKVHLGMLILELLEDVGTALLV